MRCFASCWRRFLVFLLVAEMRRTYSISLVVELESSVLIVAERRAEELIGAEFQRFRFGCVRSLRRAGASGAARSRVLQLPAENASQQCADRQVSDCSCSTTQREVDTPRSIFTFVRRYMVRHFCKIMWSTTRRRKNTGKIHWGIEQKSS